MANTSGTYNFQSVTAERLINEAYENIGIPGELQTPLLMDSARTSINLILLDWQNKSPQLFSLKTAYLGLTPYQGKYTLPSIVSKIIQANIRVYTRQLNGTPQSNTASSYDGMGGGNPAFAFDDNAGTSCTQTVAGGNISYDYGLSNAVLTGVTGIVTFVGLQFNETRTYSIVIEYSQDLNVWNTLQTLAPQEYEKGIVSWFDITSPVFARAFRVRETGTATLDLQEIYFANNVNDLSVTEISRAEYISRSNKNQTGRPGVYYFDRQMTPTLNLLSVPVFPYNCLQYSYIEKLQDVGQYTNAVDIPSHYYPALTAALAYRLALKPTNKVDPNKLPILKAESDAAFAEVSRDDSESTPITITTDYNRSMY